MTKLELTNLIKKREMADETDLSYKNLSELMDIDLAIMYRQAEIKTNAKKILEDANRVIKILTGTWVRKLTLKEKRQIIKKTYLAYIEKKDCLVYNKVAI